MANLKTMKRGILFSIISIFICFTALLGTTYAWFTDSVISSSNVIKTGTLDLEMKWAEGQDDPVASETFWTDSSEGAIFNNDKWEPGYTEAKHIKLHNVGTLALKYKIAIVPNGEVENVADVIDVYLLPEAQAVSRQVIAGLTPVGSLREMIENPNGFINGALYAEDASTEEIESVKIFTIALQMNEELGNEYQNQSVGMDFDIQCLATQYSKEIDGFGDEYDGEAQYPILPDKWDGTADTSWYDENATTFSLTSAEQLAGMNQLLSEGITFEGKTILLESDMDMSGSEWKCAVADFSGTFDGKGHTISNLERTVNEYEKGGRMGLFGHVESGTVKNITLDSADFYGYGPYGGVVAGSAYGDCVFENITLTNCNNEMYNTGSAGIIGLAYSDSNYIFTGISIDNSNTIGSYWGSWDTPVGGLIGYFWKSGETLSPVLVKDCYIAPEFNVYNDTTANYQYYAYRYSGMLIGYVDGSTIEIDGTTYPFADTVVCENVVVEYGDWADMYYCEMVKNGKASYTHDYKFSRLIPISSLEEIKTGDVWTKAGNFVLVEGDNAICYHIIKDEETGELKQYHHSEAGTQEVDGEIVDIEDKVCQKLVFDQLYGGGQGVYGYPEHEGVEVIYNNK